jgi:glycosyltransferase involved in cell wall biosynthesis
MACGCIQLLELYLMHSKKVLLVTETPPKTPNGFGVTLQCMFKNTPHDVLYTDAAFSDHVEEGYTLAQVPYHKSKIYLLKFISGKIPEWRKRYSKKWLIKNVSDEHSMVYAFVYSTDCLNYASWVSQKKNIPLVVHLADHSDLFEKSPITNILRECSKLICITKDMKSKYESTLGRKDIKVLHNGAEDQCFNIPPPHLPPFSKNNSFALCFLGGLFSHLHGDCIEDIFESVSQIRKYRPELEFHIYGQLQPSNFLSDQLKRSGVTYHGIVMPLEKKYEIMQRAHCFVVPSSFNPNHHKDYRYSFPTKLPELLASGRPILSYGPRDTATNRFLETNRLGIRIHQRSVNKLVWELSSIIDHYEENLQKAANATSLIETSYSANVVRQKLTEILKIV